MESELSEHRFPNPSSIKEQEVSNLKNVSLLEIAQGVHSIISRHVKVTHDLTPNRISINHTLDFRPSLRGHLQRPFLLLLRWQMRKCHNEKM